MLKLGIIGAGHLGKIHIKCAKEITEYKLLGFYDVDAKNAREVSDTLGVTYYSNMEQLIDECDVIDIVTPTITHYEIAAKAIKKSKHVFIEKPLTNTIEEAKKLLSLSKEANVMVQVGHVERFNPAFVAAQPFCNQPMFIETHRLAQFNPRGTDVSVVLDLMIHDIDIVLSLVKSNIKKISANGVSVVSTTPDITNARLEFDNGCVANLTASRMSMKNMRKTRIFQRDAYVSIDFLEKKTNLIRLKEVAYDQQDPFAITLDTANDNSVKQIYIENPNVASTNAIREELLSFYNSIINNTTPAVSIEDGYAALDVAYKIINKIKHNSVTF